MPESDAIPVKFFREIMVLPLALSSHADCEHLQHWCQEIEKASPWKAVNAGGSEGHGLLRHVPPSMAYEPFSRRMPSRQAPQETPETYDRRWAYAEAAYFHPFVQRFLYADGTGADSALRLFRRHDIRSLRVVLGYGCDIAHDKSTVQAFAIDLAVERLDLYVMLEPGLAMLVVEVAAPADAQVTLLRELPLAAKSTVMLGGRPFEVSGSRSRLTLAEVLALHDGLRRVYPPFFDSLGGERSDGSRHPPQYRINFFPAEVIPRTTKPSAAAVDRDFDFSSRDALWAVETLLDHPPHLPVAPWWRSLLEPVIDLSVSSTEQDAPHWRQVIDDRVIGID